MSVVFPEGKGNILNLVFHNGNKGAHIIKIMWFPKDF